MEVFVMKNIFVLLLLLSFSWLYGMQMQDVREIKSIPCIISSSGYYRLSDQVQCKFNVKRKQHFSAAIRIYNNAYVILDLNGSILNANGRTFAIDANFAKGVVIYNGKIVGANQAVSSLNNDVFIQNVTAYNCAHSSFETTQDKTYLNHVKFVHCGE
jgi:hypothetical protein